MKVMKNLYWIVVLLISFQSSFGQRKSNPAQLKGKKIAQSHALIYDKPAPDFFEGALLGNGGMGVVVTTRPDAVVLYFGHNNVWDIRIAEDNREKIKDFQYVFNKVKNIPDTLSYLTEDSWYNEYNRMAGENYSKPYPRPFPCGSVVLGFDRRKIEMIGHELDISNGLCTVKLLTEDKKEVFLQLFTDMHEDQLWMQLIDKKGNPHPNVFDRIKILPDPSTPNDFPKYEVLEKIDSGILSFRQLLPYQEYASNSKEEGHAKDKAFSLTVKTNDVLKKTSRVNWHGNIEPMPALEAAFMAKNDFVAVITLQEGLNKAVSRTFSNTAIPSTDLFKARFANNEAIWESYWSKSSIQLDDDFLESVWYRNLYFFNCAAKEGITCPGLFANWSYNNIGTAWHGDYHMNYNTQQPFWMTFSSNHLEKNLPYVELIESLMPVSCKWAKEYYGLPGAFFPHSAYPVEMTMNPYPIPDWGWEVCETPWAVQGLWWHYIYSGDTTFLRTRAYSPIKAAVEFLVAYMKRPEVYDNDRWKDNNYHIFPTVPPELYGLRPGFKYNYDSSIDLALTKFIFNAFIQAVEILKTAENDQKLVVDIKDILNNYPDYPIAQSEEYGEIFVSVPEEDDKMVYNVPLALAPVFPGEDYGMHSNNEIFGKLINTYKNQQNEGGNDLVFINLQAARIGMLDIEKFKRQINYSLLPNGTATDMVMQTGGRYSDETEYGYMKNMGIWFENFALPAVINECLMQSYNGTIRLFPNWPKEKDASFNDLRAAGAFLISATQQEGKVTAIKIYSEKGNTLHLIVPWGSKGTIIRPAQKQKIKTSVLVLKTFPGEVITLRP